MTTPWSEIRRATNNGTEIAYQVTGSESSALLVLVAGLGEQMLYWHDDLCGSLAERGFRVVRIDNRDVGLSTHLDERPRSRARTLVLPASVAAYGIEEMASDVIAVLDALGRPRAHLMGCSLGGAVVQQAAISHPDRVASLISVMSAPSLRIGRGKLRALVQLVRGKVHTGVAAEQRYVRLYRAIGSPGFSLDVPWLREVAALAYERCYDPGGVRRQLAALLVAPDRRRALGAVTAPTLVLHGEEDPVFRPSGGAATAAAIPGARLVTYAGMGHDLPRQLWPAMLDEVCAVTGG